MHSGLEIFSMSLRSQREKHLRGPPNATWSRRPTVNVRTGLICQVWLESVRSRLLHRFSDVSEEAEQGGRPPRRAPGEPQERLRLAGALQATIDHAVHLHGLQ